MPSADTVVSAPDSPAPMIVSFWKPVLNLSITLLLTAVALSLFSLFSNQTGFEPLIVALGWAHVVLAILFIVGRAIRNEPGVRTNLILLSAMTAVLFTAHYLVNIVYVIFSLFLFHAFRDELFIYFQTRGGPNAKKSVYALAGFLPLLLLAVAFIQPQDFRQQNRRVEVTASEMNHNGWSLLSFKPIEGSLGKNFFFDFQALRRHGDLAYSIAAENGGSRGGLRLGDRRWDAGSSLAFVPVYSGQNTLPPDLPSVRGTAKSLNISIGDRVGQTFIAQSNDLAGIWLNTSIPDTANSSQQFIFRLASPPMLPFDAPLKEIRSVAIVILILLFVWLAFPGLWTNRESWFYLLIIVAAAFFYQRLVKSTAGFGYILPNFLFVPVFHYFSWYVFSYNKFFGIGKASPQQRQQAAPNRYDQWLSLLRKPAYFTLTIVVLNAVSFAGVYLYYGGAGPGSMRYLFDYDYFLYFLLFHVMFSFDPAGAAKGLMSQRITPFARLRSAWAK